jgi:pilus assembly protein FimV
MSSARRPSAFPFRLTILGAAVASIMLTANVQAEALGKLKVLSTLGQPLQAEIELISTAPEEAESLEAKVASFDTFRQANIEYNPVLSSLRFAIDRRAGRRVIRVTSAQPVNEPFVDLLLELRSNDGRLVREYLFLLDPPGTGDAATAPSADTHRPSTSSTVQPATPRAVRTTPAKPARPPVAQHQPAPAVTAERPARSKPAASPDRPHLALTDISVSPGSATFPAEERAAMEKAVADANERVRTLEQKVDAMQKLLGATNNLLVELRKHNEMSKMPVDVAPPATAAASASVASTAAPVASTVAPASASPTVPATPAASAVADAKPQEAAATIAVPTAPVPVRKPAAPVPVKPHPAPPPAETGLLDNLFALSAGGLSLLLFGAAGAYFMRRRQQKPFDATTLYAEGGVAPNSAPAPTVSQDADAEQSVFIPGYADTAASPGAGDDPVAEADVYIAYGRDGQAEQILKDALQKQPERHAVRLKLLSIYASRKDRGSFEQLARELHGMTGGQGEEWSHAAALGAVIDPSNGLYAAHANEPDEVPAAMPGVPVPDVLPATLPDEPAKDAGRSMPSFDFTHGDAPSAELAMPAPALPLLDMAPAPPAAPAAIDLDFALHMPSAHAEQAPTPASVAEEHQPGPGPIDFDLGFESAPTIVPVVEQEVEAAASGPGPIEFDLPELPLTAPEELATESAVQAGKPSESGPGPIDFDFDLPEIPALAQLEEGAKDSQSAAGTKTETALDFDGMLADLLPPEKKPE